MSDTLPFTSNSAYGLWGATEGSEGCVTEAKASYTGDGVDGKEERLDEAETDNTPVRGLSGRGAEHTLGRTPEDYTKKPRDALHLISISKFPTELPSSLPALSRRESTGDALEFTSQRNYSPCGDPLPSCGRDVAVKLVLKISRYFRLSSKTEDICRLAISIQYQELLARGCCHVVARGGFKCLEATRKAELATGTFHAAY